MSISAEDIHFSPEGTKMYLLTNNGAKITFKAPIIGNEMRDCNINISNIESF
jgi:hypothetical protein